MLCYQLVGNGTPLLLIHGWGVTYAIWQNLAPLLTPYFQLIMIELPGVGGSPEVDPDKPYYQACAEAIEEVRQELGIKQWLLLAYSSGTWAAEAYPQSIVQVVFLCPIYLPEIWAFLLRLLDTAHPQVLTQWILSDWRLYSLIRIFGFNWKRHTYTRVWKSEIELQPLDILVRSLCEMPGNGGAPFELPAVPTLFITSSQETPALQARGGIASPYLGLGHGANLCLNNSLAGGRFCWNGQTCSFELLVSQLMCASTLFVSGLTLQALP